MAQTAPKLAAYLFSFLSAPVVLQGLGLRRFGIWALTGALAQYGALLDLGVGASLARYIAAHQSDRRLCGEYMAIGWLSVGVIAAVLGPVTFAAAPLLSHALGGISTSDMRIVLCSSASLMCCSMAMSVICAYPIGRRRMVAPNIGITIGAAINFVASVGSIALGAKLPGYALANAGAGVLWPIVVAIVVIHAEGPIPFAIPDRRRMREFLAFSIKNQLVRVTALVNYQTDKVVIAFAVGPSAAGAYELANRVAIAVREVANYATSAISIELTWLRSHFGSELARERYRRLNEVSATLVFPPMLLLMATAPLLLEVWLSHAPPNSVAILVCLCAAYLMGASTAVGYALAVAAGEPGVVARSSVAAAVANIILTASLSPIFGIWGVLAGTVVALTLGALAQVFLVHRRFSIPARDYIDAVVPPLVICTLLALPVLAFCYTDPVHGRGLRAIALVLLSALYLMACGVWALRARRLPVDVATRLARLPWLRSRSWVARRALERVPRRHASEAPPVSSEMVGHGVVTATSSRTAD